MDKRPNVIRRHPLGAYFVLAFALAWWPWPLTILNPESIAIIPWSPIVAAFLVAAIATGRPGVKSLFAAMVRWRVGLVWYGVALALPIALVRDLGLRHGLVWGTGTD